MEENSKEIYEAPTVEVVELQAEGVVCGSTTTTDYDYYNLDS
jgi:hypothetical protein